MKSPSTRWGSGLAVRFLEAGAEQPATRPEFTVAIRGPRLGKYEDWKKAIESTPSDTSSTSGKASGKADRKAGSHPPPTHEDFVKDSINVENHMLIAMSAAQYQLEKRGYYAVFADDAAAGMDVDQVAAMDDKALNEMFGRDSEHILFIDLSIARSVNIGFAASASSRVAAKLYSRSARKVVWEGSASASLFPTMGLLNVIAESGSSRRERAVFMAVRKALKTLAQLQEKPR